MALVPVTELYTTNIVQDGADLTAVRLFNVDTTPDLALDSSVTGGGIDPGTGATINGLPQLGEVHPQDATLFVDRRGISDRPTPEVTTVSVLYKRVTLGDIDRVSVANSEAQGFFVNEPVTQVQFLNVPRILRRMVSGADEYVVYNTQQPVSELLFRVTVHIDNFTVADRQLIDSKTNHIDTSLNTTGEVCNTHRAMFTGGDVRFLGKNKWRIIYGWKVRPFFKKVVGFDINPLTNTLVSGGGGGTVLDVENGDVASQADPVAELRGGFYPFSTIGIMRQGITELQQPFVEGPPLYLELPDRTEFIEEDVFALLPGLVPVNP